MNEFIQNMVGMGDITDQVIATDLLISAKSGVRNYAIAITETATPELRDVLHQQLNQAIDLHEKVSNYMITNGYYHPSHLNEQVQVDAKATQTALNIPNPQ